VNPVIDPDELARLCATHGLAAWTALDLPLALPDSGLDDLLADGIGDLAWLTRHRNLRRHPAELLPGSVSLLMALFPYAGPVPAGDGFVRAAYAHGGDYHRRLRRRLARLGAALVARAHDLTGQSGAARACVDSAPLPERTLAQLSGLGWIGRSGLLLHPELGSRTHIGCLLLTLPLPTSSGGHATNRCGACRRCVTACPTGAIADDRLRATRCISYLTIEHRGAIPGGLAARCGGRWFGCDACQDCCPWNHATPAATTAPDDLDDLAGLDAAGFARVFAGSAIRRLGYARYRRNLLVAANNLGRPDVCHRLLAGGPELVVEQGRELGLRV
jgi:epoxyqueuosine reductase